jgi:hypothetical protein
MTEETTMDYDISDSAPERKAGFAGRDGFDDLRATFEEFKSANDERLAKLERGRGDVLLEQKVDLADPQHQFGARDLRKHLQEAVHDHGPRRRLGRRDRRARADRIVVARRAVVPGDGALCDAGGDRDVAR